MLWWEIVLIILLAVFVAYIIIEPFVKTKNKKECTNVCSGCAHSKECQKALNDLKAEFTNMKQSNS